MAHSAGHDIASGLLTRVAVADQTATGGGAGDGTDFTGLVIDTQSLGARYNAAALSVVGRSTQASGNSLTVAVKVEKSANNSDWVAHLGTTTAYTQTATGGALTAASAGGAVNVRLDTASRYVRAVVTPTLSATGTDTAIVSAHWVFGNPDKV